MTSDLKYNTGAELPTDQADLLRGTIANIWGLVLGTKINLTFALNQMQFILNSSKANLGAMKVWKTIEVADLPKASILRKAMNSVGSKIDPTAKEQLSVYDGDMKFFVDLVKISAEDLGFDRPATLQQIYKTAFKFGLQNCMPIIGPILRAAYIEQQKGEWLKIASPPFVLQDKKSYLFELGSDKKGLVLDVAPADPRLEFLPEDIFVFVI